MSSKILLSSSLLETGNLSPRLLQFIKLLLSLDSNYRCTFRQNLLQTKKNTTQVETMQQTNF